MAENKNMWERGTCNSNRKPSLKPASDPVHAHGLPKAQGLYDPRNEHDACGIGFIAHMKNDKSHDIVQKGLGAFKQSRASRRRWCGPEGRRWLRHTYPDASPPV